MVSILEKFEVDMGQSFNHFFTRNILPVKVSVTRILQPSNLVNDLPL